MVEAYIIEKQKKREEQNNARLPLELEMEVPNDSSKAERNDESKEKRGIEVIDFSI